MSFDAYKVAVKLTLVNQVSSGLASIAGQFRNLNKDAMGAQAGITAVHSELLKMQRLGLVGGALAGLGFGGLTLFKAPLQAARDYELAYTKFKTLNLGGVINQQADAFSRGAMLMGVSSKELMTTLTESIGLFGSFDVAKKLAPQLALLNKANSAIFNGKIDHIDEGATRSLMKFIDRRGGTHDEESFMRNLNLAQKMVTGSGGFIKFRDLDQFSQQGGTAFRGLSDEGLLNMALLLQEQGGARAGTSLMSLYQNLIAGRTPKKTMAMLQEFGLGTLAMQEHATVGGKSLKSLVMTNIKEADLLQANPPQWMQSVFLPALAAKGISADAGILKATNDLLSNRSASGQASIMTTQVLQLLRDANLTKNAMGVDQTIATYRKDPNSQFSELHARWNGLLIELGITALPLAIRGVQGLTSGIKTLTSFARDNPGTVKALTGAFISLSSAMAFGGTVMLLSAAFKGLSIAKSSLVQMPSLIGNAISKTGTLLGWLGRSVLFLGRALLTTPIGLTITAIAGAAYLLYRNWSTVGPYLMKTWEVIKYAFNSSVDWIGNKIKAMWEIVRPAVNFYVQTWTSIFDTVKTGVSAVYDFVSGIIRKIWDKLQNSAIGRALGVAIDSARNLAQNTATSIRESGTKLYTDAIASNYAASYSNEGRNSIAAAAPKVQVSPVVHTVPAPPATQRSVAPPPREAQPVFKVENKFDFHGLTTRITQIQAREMSRPPTGPSAFDGSMNLRALGTSFAGG